MPANLERQPHADSSDRTMRVAKARKILALISRYRPVGGAQLLEIGTAAGLMAQAFAQAVGAEGKVWAVDRFDLREVFDGYDFVQVDDARLPFDDESFDVVVSNHVLEHVGDVDDQVVHLRDIRRVLRPDGVAYVSVPNRWRVIEPHFHMPFLSWLPPKLSSAYVRLARKGQWYDVVPPSRARMRQLFEAADVEWVDVTMESMRVMAEVEPTGSLTRRLLTAPEWLVRPGMAIVPSMIYVAWRPGRA